MEPEQRKLTEDGNDPNQDLILAKQLKIFEIMDETEKIHTLKQGLLNDMATVGELIAKQVQATERCHEFHRLIANSERFSDATTTNQLWEARLKVANCTEPMPDVTSRTHAAMDTLIEILTEVNDMLTNFKSRVQEIVDMDSLEEVGQLQIPTLSSSMAEGPGYPQVNLLVTEWENLRISEQVQECLESLGSFGL